MKGSNAKYEIESKFEGKCEKIREREREREREKHTREEKVRERGSSELKTRF